MPPVLATAVPVGLDPNGELAAVPPNTELPEGVPPKIFEEELGVEPKRLVSAGLAGVADGVPKMFLEASSGLGVDPNPLKNPPPDPPDPPPKMLAEVDVCAFPPPKMEPELAPVPNVD